MQLNIKGLRFNKYLSSTQRISFFCILLGKNIKQTKKYHTMRTTIKIAFLAIMAASLFSCEDVVKDTYTVNEPVYMSYSELRASFEVLPQEEIIKPGKIYFKDELIFVNEYQKGIHIIDNTEPTNPVVLKFLEIPGNVDMAIKGDILYADSYVDLLSIDISDLDNIKEVDRDQDAFPYIIPKVEDGIVKSVDQTQGVIVGYKQTQVTEKVEDVSGNFQWFNRWGMTEDAVNFRASPAKTGGAVGVGGSMARFTIYDNYLYAIDHANLKIFDITTLENPVYKDQVYVRWNIETLFPYGQRLFIGGQTGMFVYSLETPALPKYISEFTHATACDPVVVEGDYAYVTLRSGNLCGAIESQLNVIDIADINDPKLVKAYPLEEPYGLGIDNDVLFICDGKAGLKVFDATDKNNIDENQLALYNEMDAFDVIPLGDLLILISVDGLFQYDYSSPKDIKKLSHIPIYGNK
jgi:hypothetical protein